MSGVGSGSPPYYSRPNDLYDPGRKMKVPQPTQEEFNHGWGTVKLRTPVYVNVGGTARFEILTYHFKDGNFDPTSLAISFLDKTGTALATSGANGATAPAVQSLAIGDWYTDVQFGVALPAGDYTAVWTGSYTAKDNNVIKLNERAYFVVRRRQVRNPLRFKRQSPQS